MSAIVNLFVWVAAGINGYVLFNGTGNMLNAIALAMCVGSGLYGLTVMSR